MAAGRLLMRAATCLLVLTSTLAANAAGSLPWTGSRAGEGSGDPSAIVAVPEAHATWDVSGDPALEPTASRDLVPTVQIPPPAETLPRNEDDAPFDAGPDTTPRQWSSITVFHGLPSDSVQAIAQDAEGLLWLATDGGLVRFDGRRVERVALREGLSPTTLGVDNKGRLFVGTTNGAFVVRGESLVPVESTEGHAVAAILYRADGSVVFASRRGTLFRALFGEDGALAVRTLGPSQASRLTGRYGPLPLTALVETGKTLIVGTHGRGILGVDGDNVAEVKLSGRPFFINALAMDSGGLLVGAEARGRERGLLALRDASLTPLDVATGTVTALDRTRSGDVFVGTRDRGVFHLRGGAVVSHLTFGGTKGGLRSDHIQALRVDRDGVLWVGTDRGLSRYDPHAPRPSRLGTTADGNFVHALAWTPDGRLFAGTQKGLYVAPSPEGPWVAVGGLEGRVVHALHVAANDALLVGTASGLLESTARGPLTAWTKLPSQGRAPSVSSIRALAELGGRVYVASFGSGLEVVESDGLASVWPESKTSGALREVVSLSRVRDSLFLGTAAGEAFTYRPAEGPSQDGAELGTSAPVPLVGFSGMGTLFSAVADGRDGVFVGTSRGLFHTTMGVWEPWLTGVDVRAIAVVPGSTEEVWCATAGRGLVRVARTEGANIVTARVGTDHGLPSDSVFALAVRARAEGVLLVLGTNRGVASYEPAREPPGLRLLRVVGRRAYSPSEWEALHVDIPGSSLLVEVAAVGGRTYPEHYQYAFTLAPEGGGSKTLVAAEGQFVTGPLSPGRYALSTTAFGTDLIPSTPLVLHFDVARSPVPWGSLALASLLLAALLALGWGTRQNRRLALSNKALGETRLQLVQETESERSRIARDLHDQTLADLRRLMLSRPAESQAFREAVESISTEVRRICEDLSPSVLENVGLTAALEWALDEAVTQANSGRQSTACRGEFTCAEGTEERIALEPAARIQVYRIAQEALTNAVRHAKPLILAVDVGDDSEVLTVTVTDDGPGFDRESAASGRGLGNIRSRASLVGASVSWSRGQLGGTQFRLTLRHALGAAQGSGIPS